MAINHPLVKKDSLTLRRYQESIISTAVDGNTLVVLPTGLGKTVIAAMVAAHRLNAHKGSKILFLAPTKPLASQHMDSFNNLLEVGKMNLLTGSIPAEKRKSLWDESEVIFATPQTIENDINNGLRLDDVSLIIFDEAHRAVGDYSYVHIAKEYLKNNIAQTLALTASPASEKEKVDWICKNLGIKNVEAKTDKDKDVKSYIQDVKIKWIMVDLPQEYREIQKRLKNVLGRQLSLLKDAGYIDSKDVNKISKTQLLKLNAQVRIEISSGRQAFAQASIIAAAIKINHGIELIETQGISALESYNQRLKKQKSKAVKNLLNDSDMIYAFEMAYTLKKKGLEHPKMKEVSRIAKKYIGKKTLIFTQYRDTVEALVEKLRSDGINAKAFIGQQSRGALKGMTQKNQIHTLAEFKNGEYDALIATSVAEEGLDIPKVDAVIFYEPIPSEIRTIQRRGRTGRTASGNIYMMICKGTRDEAYYWSSYHKERRMGALVNKMKNEPGYFEDKSQKILTQYGVETEKEITIIQDTREKNSNISAILREKSNLKLATLPVGDYLVSERVGVERKTVSDFIQSIVDGRLMNQMKELSNNYEKPVLIVEGVESMYSVRNIHPNAVRGALASCALDFKVSVICAEDAADTAYTIIALAKREQLDNKKPISLHANKKVFDIFEQRKYVIESLPNISATLAERLLKHFGSVKAVINADEEKLKEIEGIGAVIAKQINDVISGKYK